MNQTTSLINGVKFKDHSFFRTSFSEYVSWRRCPLRFKLETLDELAEPFRGNIYTLFGSLIGQYVEELFAGEREFEGVGRSFMIDFERTCLENQHILDNDSNKRNRYSKKLVTEFTDQGILILDAVRTKLNKNGWAKWKFIAYEHPIFMHIPDEYNGGVIDDRPSLLIEDNNVINENYNNAPYFKGFIDLIVEDEEGKILIIDFKSATRPWDRYKKGDQNLKAQLKLYKYFYHLETGRPLNDIRTMFIVLPRTQTKRYYQEIELEFGQRAITNELKKLSQFFKEVYKQKKYFPNIKEENCKYCPFKKTKHCKNS